jgi:hypothetical protein
MSFLSFIWLLSFVVLVATTLYAFHRARYAPLPRYIPHDLGEFIHEAVTHTVKGVRSVASSARPHAEKVTLHVVSLSKWGHDKFIDRVFGKTVLAPGKTASFFLKYIAEHKEETKGSAAQKAGLQK